MRRHNNQFTHLLFAASALLAGGLVFVLFAPDSTSNGAAPIASAMHAARSDLDILPLSPAKDLDSNKVALGKKLFLDSRLSADDTISCASCHDLKRGGVDRRTVSLGVNHAVGSINAPTVFNSSLNFVQFWDGRAGTLEEQAAGPIHNPAEMATNWPAIMHKLQADTSYQSTFARLYEDGITPENIQNALATFERSLITPNSRFDRYLRGEITLSNDEARGFQRFRELGCTACHQGMLLGGNMFQKFGVLRDYFKGRRLTSADMGRKNVTGRQEDLHVFKVPSLRNVAVTPPYFHDGSANSLEEAVAVMGRHQLGRELGSRDVHQITAFLGTLTGEWEGKPLQ